MSDEHSEHTFFPMFFIYFAIGATIIPPIIAITDMISLGIIITIFFMAVFIFHWIYKKHIKPINERIEAIIHGKSTFFPPVSVLTMHKNIKKAGKRIVLIRKKMTKTIDYITMLAHNKKDDAINGMIAKQNEYYNYFFNCYDNYCSLYLEMRFQFYMSIMKDVIIAAKKISRIDIKRFIDTIKTDIKCMGYVLKSKRYLPDRPGKSDYLSDYLSEQMAERFFAIVKGFEIITDIEGTAAAFFTDENTGKKSKETPPGKDGDGEKQDMVFKKTNASIRAINRKIQAAAVYLITLQSNKIIGDTSPIDEENALNMQKKEHDFTTSINYSKILDDEYDRFMAEVELSENNSG
jgi:hypothetical protein